MNKAILLGRLTKDPELRYTINNVAACSFTLAVSRKYSKQDDPVTADFIPIIAWRQTAEFCSKYFQRGQQVAVVGRIQTRSWEDNEGKKHYVTEVIAEETFFADSKKDKNETGNYEKGFNPDEMPTTQFLGLDEDDDLPF
ncbi:MAG TPA: single-stranded DNA-binding protein [Clostridiales bacterium]|nr:single-stranded DNA-binding protein [Clostridiales bacterium]